MQEALAWNGTKALLSISSVIAACLLEVTFSDVTVPTGAPAMRTSSPVTIAEALSKIARTSYGSPPLLQGATTTTTTAATTSTSTVAVASLLMVRAGRRGRCSR